MDVLPPVPTERLFGVSVSALSMDETVARIMRWSSEPPARTVAAADLDHMIKRRRDAQFRRALNEMDLVTPAGRSLVWLSRLERTPPRARLSGPGLLREIAQSCADAGRSIFLFGSTHTELHAAAKALRAQFPGLKLAGAYAPPAGFERDPAIHRELVTLLRTVRPDIIAVALDAPRQAIWSAGMADCVRRGVFIGIGDELHALMPSEQPATGTAQTSPLVWLWHASLRLLRRGARVLHGALYLPVLLAAHHRDRAAHDAQIRRRAVALESERHYRQERADVRRKERSAALDAKAEETIRTPYARIRRTLRERLG